MKEYENPLMEIVQLYGEDVITTSDYVEVPSNGGWTDED